MKAKIEFQKPDGTLDAAQAKEIDAKAEELAKLSLTPGFIVRMPAAPQAPDGLKFVGADEDGFRRVGPA